VAAGAHRSPRVVLAVLALALAAAGCLPASVRPTPAPVPTPTPTPTPSPSPTPTPGPPTPTPAPTFVLHTVVSGDSLTSLGRKFHTSGRSIAYWNRAQFPSLDPESPSYKPDNLKRGWILQILPGQEYLPSASDFETGITPSPSDNGDAGSAAPDPSASPDASAANP
jgi:hypothetical protein